jgi:hypothetical protein
VIPKLDFAKAFDTLDHSAIKRVFKWGIRSQMVELVRYESRYDHVY